MICLTNLSNHDGNILNGKRYRRSRHSKKSRRSRLSKKTRQSVKKSRLSKKIRCSKKTRQNTNESDGGERINRLRELRETMDRLEIPRKYLIPISGLVLSVYQLQVAWEEFNETYIKNDNIKWHREKEFMKFLKNYIPYKADKYFNELSHGFLY